MSVYRRVADLIRAHADGLALATVTIAALVLRLVRLDDPKSIMFDETYYAKDACWYVETSPSLCEIENEQTGVHPPLGKWMIALGIRLFGYDSFGWRIAPAIAGVLTVMLLYLLARRLLGSVAGALIASSLLAIDFLHFVQSRIAMLDVFVGLFTVAAFLFVVIDKQRLINAREGPQEEGLPDPAKRTLFRRPWRAAAGLAGGAAVACKWSGGLALLAIIVLTITWEVASRRSERGIFKALGRTLKEESFTIVAYLVLLPLVFYIGTYAGRLEGSFLAMPWAEGSWLRAWWDQQGSMLNFHANLTDTHPYQSPAWTWILLKRPVSYFFQSEGDVDYREVIAIGSPFVWWASVLAYAFVTYRWLRSRSFVRPEGTIVAGWLFTYGIWLLPLTDRGAVFLFYLLPTLPFMCLALAYVAVKIGRTWEARAAQALFMAGAIALFAFYYPILAKTSITREQWEKRIWIFGRDEWCEKVPGGTPVTETVTQTVEGSTSTSTSVTTDTGSLPTKGWCWI